MVCRRSVETRPAASGYTFAAILRHVVGVPPGFSPGHGVAFPRLERVDLRRAVAVSDRCSANYCRPKHRREPQLSMDNARAFGTRFLAKELWLEEKYGADYLSCEQNAPRFL